MCCRAAVLVLVWLLAMAGGLLFKRFILGAKGWEQVPLIDWYKAFGNLEAVSFSVACLGMVCQNLHCTGWLWSGVQNTIDQASWICRSNLLFYFIMLWFIMCLEGTIFWSRYRWRGRWKRWQLVTYVVTSSETSPQWHKKNFSVYCFFILYWLCVCTNWEVFGLSIAMSSEGQRLGLRQQEIISFLLPIAPVLVSPVLIYTYQEP